MQSSLCAKRLHSQWPCWHLALIMSIRQVVLLTYLQDIWLINLSLVLLVISFEKFCSQWTHVLFTFSWNLRMDIEHIIRILLRIWNIYCQTGGILTYHNYATNQILFIRVHSLVVMNILLGKEKNLKYEHINNFILISCGWSC